MAVRESMSTVIVGRRALLREGIAALLLHTAYKVVASAASSSEVRNITPPPGRRTLVILGIGDGNSSSDEATENIRELRSQFVDSKIVMVAETSRPIDIQRILVLRPDGYILNLGSRDILLKALELVLMDQQVLVLGPSMPRSTVRDDAETARPSLAGRAGAPP
jgi:DNA-binding NarL/FixJ family response regulator